jgi:hypothetical protein
MYSGPWSYSVSRRKLAVLSASASFVFISETWFNFTYEVDVYTEECVVFEMRYAATFNKFTVNTVVLPFVILFPWLRIIQKGKRDA